MPTPNPWSLVIVLALAGSSPQAPEPAVRASAIAPAERTENTAAARRPPAAPRRGDMLPGPFPAELLEIVDGDSVEARVTIWLGQHITTRIRLRNIDAPELSSDCADERRRATAAREALRGLIDGLPIVLADVGLDKYGGRVLASLRLANGQDIGRAMIASGHARPYQGGRREPWCAAIARR